MTKHTLKIEKREIVGRKVKKLRAQGVIPANIFGKNVTSESIQMNQLEFEKLYKSVGESTLIYLGDKPVLIRQIVRHPVSGKLLHVEFNQVNLKEKAKTQVKMELIGESPAVKDGKGILVQQADHVEIEALPADIPEHIEVDVSNLTEVDQTIAVKDLKTSTKFNVISDPETIIVKIEELAKEVEVVKEVVVAPPADETTPGPVVS